MTAEDTRAPAPRDEAIDHLRATLAPGGSASPATQEFAIVPLSRRNAFLVPLHSRLAARHSLTAYVALRPRATQVVRRVLGAAWAVGLPEHVLRGRAVLPTGDDTLLGYLGAVLDEPRLTFATGLRPAGSFYTPVLQLFRPDGTPVAYAKIGWDDVTNTQVRAESDALRAVGAAGGLRFRVPDLLHAGAWQHLELCVTAPLPPTSRKVPDDQLPPVQPLLDVAALDAPIETVSVRSSRWWRAIEADAPGLESQAPGLGVALAALAADVGDVELRFGRWHGDWVFWNMALAPDGLYVWDWEYSRPDVPLGFDLLHYFFQEAFVYRKRPLVTAFSLAGAQAANGLRQLGFRPDEQAVLRRLHRLEVRLRAERAVSRGAEADPGIRNVEISTLLAHG